MMVALTTATIVAVLMEAWAAWMHGGLWHGPLWGAHKSHHPEESIKRRGVSARWEHNDIFGLLHAGMAAALIVVGLTPPWQLKEQLALGVGSGMTAFGLAYAVVHDGFVHHRLPVQFLSRSAFLRRVAAAHRVHHKLGGPPYGLFSGPYVLRKRNASKRASTATQP